MVVRGSEDGEVVGGGDGSVVLRSSVVDGGVVGSDGSFVYVVISVGIGEEIFVVDNGIDVGGGVFEEVEEGMVMEVGLFEVEVEFGVMGSGSGEEVEEIFEFEVVGKVVGEFEFGVESVGGVLSLGEGEVWLWKILY